MFYYNTYYALCQRKKSLKEKYGRGSGLHRHRILPGHSGGEYVDDNVTYLTPREHTIAHFLLWKIYKNPNDLRSMYVLGAQLTTKQRKITGKWCYENNIGFHKYHGTEFHKQYSKKGLETQKEQYEKNGNKQNFYYWSTEEGRTERSSLGGKVSWNLQKETRNGLPFFMSEDPDVRRQNAIKAAKMSPKFPVTNGVICKKLYTEEERNQFLLRNPSFKSGGRPYKRKDTEKRCWMNNGTSSMQIKISLINEYTSKGWVKGRIKQ